MTLQWIVDRAAVERGIVAAVLGAGVRRVHLREPGFGEKLWRAQFSSPPAGLREIVVNGGPGWARDAGWGAHLKAAQPNLPAGERERWRCLGRSVHDADEVLRALADRPDYLVAGPVYPTGCKPGHPGIGLRGLAAIVEAAAGVPVRAIGGVTPRRVEELRAAGARGVTVRSGIGAAGDPVEATRAYRAACEALPADLA